jgi:hypothetical protein
LKKPWSKKMHTNLNERRQIAHLLSSCHSIESFSYALWLIYPLDAPLSATSPHSCKHLFWFTNSATRKFFDPCILLPMFHLCSKLLLVLLCSHPIWCIAF